MELSPRAIELRLAREPRAVLATLRADGSAALVPIVFAWVSGALWSPIDGKPKRGAALARVANLARDSRVSVLLDAYAEDWSRLWWLRVEGVARATSASIAPAEAALRAKYSQYAATPLHVGAAQLLRIEPARVASWAASAEAVRAAEEDR
ncbi:MAG: pyridoxamine 5'-phosphate oxidase family protein [Deltaproteobacteria bacterium]|nr:pyridoxamine 5'-phosphate oxidase family protein [Deltaproteobacteria bacterium]